MANDIYYTIAPPGGEAKVTEKMSRFLAFAIPVNSVDQAKAILKDYQNKYHDARHVCWAYTIGPDRALWQLNDNGEPSGTAGKPILGQINSANLTDIIIIVVRYFGGIKLGTSGLIAAYRQAAREAIEACQIIELFQTASISFTFPYMAMNDVMRLAKQPGVEITAQQFDNSCSMTLNTRLDSEPELRARLLSISGLTLA